MRLRDGTSREASTYPRFHWFFIGRERGINQFGDLRRSSTNTEDIEKRLASVFFSGNLDSGFHEKRSSSFPSLQLRGFCMGSKANESDNHNRISGDFSDVPLDQSSLFTYQTAVTAGYSNGEFRYDHGIFQQPLLFDKSIDYSATQLENFQVIQNGRKRQIIEVNDIFPKNYLGGSIGERTTSNEWNKNKRSKVTNSQQQWHNQFQEISMETQDNRRLQVPVRRSRKLSDKITALQKLVSPYGKTDTASVLQEASVYIVLLQQQIQNLHRIFSSSYINAVGLHSQESGSSSQVLDLRSKGLCLVPISMTQKVTMEEGFDEDHLSTSRNFVIANHF
ncbi:hypothetical protein ACLB2K_074640 [Fragaria x ananassa]